MATSLLFLSKCASSRSVSSSSVRASRLAPIGIAAVSNPNDLDDQD